MAPATTRRTSLSAEDLSDIEAFHRTAREALLVADRAEEGLSEEDAASQDLLRDVREALARHRRRALAWYYARLCALLNGRYGTDFRPEELFGDAVARYRRGIDAYVRSARAAGSNGPVGSQLGPLPCPIDEERCPWPAALDERPDHARHVPQPSPLMWLLCPYSVEARVEGAVGVMGLEEAGRRATVRRLLQHLSPGDVRVGRRHVHLDLGLDPDGLCREAAERAGALVDAAWLFERPGEGRAPEDYLAKVRRQGPLFTSRISPRLEGARPRIVCVQAFKAGSVRLHFGEHDDLAAFVRGYRLDRLTGGSAASGSRRAFEPKSMAA